MASKNVALRMDVVRKLDRLKRKGESYSDVIDREIRDEPSWAEVIAFLRANRDTGPDVLGPRIRQNRKQMDLDFETRRKRLEKVL